MTGDASLNPSASLGIARRAYWVGTLGRLVLVLLILFFVWSPSATFTRTWRSCTDWLPSAAGDDATLKWMAESVRDYPGLLNQWLGRAWPTPTQDPAQDSTEPTSPPSQQFWRLAHDRTWKIIALNWVMGLLILPLFATLLIGPRRPFDLGVRWPDRTGWIVAGVAILVAMPLVIGIALTPDFVAAYQQQSELSYWSAYYALIVMGPEHFLFQGLVLAWFHPSRKFPQMSGDALGTPLVWPWPRSTSLDEPTPDADTPSGWRWGAFIRSLWIGWDCIPAVVLSGLLFFLVHWGKPPAELWLSLPGGCALAWIAVRLGSFVIPFLIHLVTAGAAYGIAVFLLR